MANKLRDIFYPPLDKQIQQCEMLIWLFKENIRYCSTCANYIGNSQSGPFTDYGRCKADCECFASKVCGLNNCDCDKYLEDTDRLLGLQSKLEQLKNEKNGSSANETDMINIAGIFADQCVSKFGTESQLDILQEECSELIKACSKFKRSSGTNGKENLIEEMAHVLVSSFVVAKIHGISTADIVREIQKKIR